jgi:RNA polymerase sigma-70 factor, ECF subfamily
MTPLKNNEPSADLAALLASHRGQIQAFLLSLTGSASAADDLTQETTLVLWEKRADYDPTGNFRAWAFQIAFYLAQNHRRRILRQERRELPGDGLFDQIAAASLADTEEIEEARAQALRLCLGKLSESHRELLLRRYLDGTTLETLSSEAASNRNALAQKLFRIKRTLIECIKRQPGTQAATLHFP